MPARMTPEVKAAKVIIDAVDRSSFDQSALATYLSMASLLVKEKILMFMSEFVEHNARLWDEESIPPGQEDFHRDCARMRDVLHMFR